MKKKDCMWIKCVNKQWRKKEVSISIRCSIQQFYGSCICFSSVDLIGMINATMRSFFLVDSHRELYSKCLYKFHANGIFAFNVYTILVIHDANRLRQILKYSFWNIFFSYIFFLNIQNDLIDSLQTHFQYKSKTIYLI